jgi:hypothetical protein
MRRGLFLLVALGLAIVAAAVLASGRRAPVIAFGTLLAGAVVAFGSTLLIDCTSCRTDALIIGAFAAAPFFLVGLIACASTPPGAGHRGLLCVAMLALLFQVGWSALVIYTATIRGDCPCAGLLINGASTTLKAVGTDRLSGPLFLLEALLGLAFLRSARQRAGVPA